MVLANSSLPLKVSETIATIIILPPDAPTASRPYREVMDTQPLALPVQPTATRAAKPAHRPHPLLIAATAGYIALIGWITLSTADNGSAVRSTSTWIIRMLERLPLGLNGEQWEFALNIAMFAPLGFLLVLTFGARFFWVAALGGIALSLSLEGLQQFIPYRVPDARDLLANGLGGVIGMFFGVALLAALPRRR